MKILIVSHYFYPFIGGVEEVAFQQAKTLVKMGYKVNVVTSNIGAPRKGHEIEDLNGIMVYRVPANNFLYDHLDIPQPIFHPLKLYKILKKIVKEADIVHIHDRFYMSSIFATVIAKTFNKPIVLTIHKGSDYDSAFYKFLFEINEKIAFYTVKNASKLVLVSEEVGNYIKKRFKREYEVIPNAVDTNFFQPGDIERKNRFIVLFVGRFIHKKGIDTVIDIAKKFGDIQFVCVGDGPRMPKIKKIIKEKSLQNILLKGNILDKNKLRECYKNADVFIFPSEKGEGLPLVILEALASGLPVIVKNTGNHAKIIENGKSGFIVEDVNEMSEKIKFLKENRDVLREMSLYSREYSEKYSWSSNIKKLISVYDSIR